MKTSKKLIPFSALPLVVALACSTIVNLAQPAPDKKTFFEETEFVDACKAESSVEVERFAKNGQFIMNVVSPSYVGWTECSDTEYADFIVEVDAAQAGGPDNNAYGVIFRYGLQSNEFYAFVVSGDGYYAFTVDGANRVEPEFLVEWTASPAVKQGRQTNRLKVAALGAGMKYYVNGQYLGEVQDSRFSKGTVGFLAGSVEEGGVQIAFDNLRISEP